MHEFQKKRENYFFFNSYDLIRVLFALTLIIASLLKGYQFATVALNVGNYFWFQSAYAFFELLFGLWLLFNFLPSYTRIASMLLLMCFIVIASWKSILGKTSCGCFGSLEINPLWLLGFDLAIFVAFLRWQPLGTRSNLTFNKSIAYTVSVCFLMLALHLYIVLESMLFPVSTLTENGTINGNGNTVVLNPNQWIGKPLPIAKYTSIGNSLLKGHWTVLFVHNDCSRCQEVIPYYASLSSIHMNEFSSSRVAFIEVSREFLELPEHAQFHSPSVISGKLEKSKKWFITTPMELTVKDGVCVHVRGYSEIMKRFEHYNF